jgi:hypothetical protein
VTAERFLTIGGRVLHGVPEVGVSDAWVQLTGLAPVELQGVVRRTTSSTDGRFVFERLRAGRYRIATVTETGQAQRDVDLPSPTGDYDVQVP